MRCRPERFARLCVRSRWEKILVLDASFVRIRMLPRSVGLLPHLLTTLLAPL